MGRSHRLPSREVTAAVQNDPEGEIRLVEVRVGGIRLNPNSSETWLSGSVTVTPIEAPKKAIMLPFSCHFAR
jgi:hypothetical protein